MVQRFFLAALATLVISAASLSAQAPACAPSGGLSFICGLKAPEDLVQIPNTRLLIASGMQAGAGLSLIDTQAKTARPLFADGAAAFLPNRARFAACPGSLDPKAAELHGLSLRPGVNGNWTLYATNHGGRESIEVFEVQTNRGTVRAVWTGCVLMPQGLEANSVAAFTDGTILATVLTLPGRGFEDLLAGRPTGIVVQWRPGSAGFEQLRGTELAGNNGIETSADDREFFVAASGAKTITAFSRMDPSKPLRVAQLREFAPDNIRRSGSRLLTAGMIDDEPACGGAPKNFEGIQCLRGWIADAIDPQTMAVTEVARGPRAAPFSGVATALVVGDEICISSFISDRLAYRSIK
jgi:hypothetical protein